MRPPCNSLPSPPLPDIVPAPCYREEHDFTELMRRCPTRCSRSKRHRRDMKKVTLPGPPRSWGNDEVTAFIDNARLNSFASYANLRSEYAKLSEIDAIFRKLVESLLNTKDWFAAFFLLRAHSAFLAGTHLGMSGQTAETYAS